MEYVVSAILIALALYILTIVKKKKEKMLNWDHIKEDSYQNFAKFFDIAEPTDTDFVNKLNNIYSLIVNKKEKSIEKITKQSGCTTQEECIVKIRYLKNKRLLDDYYIDIPHDEILMCTKEDQKLLEKYKPFIYHSHLQINEIANVIPNRQFEGIQELKEHIYNDLTYLDKKNLLNGIKIDTIDRKIIYYTIEKKKTHEGYETIHCPNCGALNDVEITGKTRCEYCNTIVKGTECE